MGSPYPCAREVLRGRPPEAAWLGACRMPGGVTTGALRSRCDSIRGSLGDQPSTRRRARAAQCYPGGYVSRIVSRLSIIVSLAGGRDGHETHGRGGRPRENAKRWPRGYAGAVSHENGRKQYDGDHPSARREPLRGGPGESTPFHHGADRARTSWLGLGHRIQHCVCGFPGKGSRRLSGNSYAQANRLTIRRVIAA